jgi:hypothetical protein
MLILPPYSKSDFERLKKSIKEHGGLLNPIILNQDNIRLDGHHRMRACHELGLPTTSYHVKNFAGKPMEELRYVVAVNLHRRHLDEFQKAQIGLKMEKIARQNAAKRQKAIHYDTQTGTEAANKWWKKPDEEVMPCASRDGGFGAYVHICSHLWIVQPRTRSLELDKREA